MVDKPGQFEGPYQEDGYTRIPRNINLTGSKTPDKEKMPYISSREARERGFKFSRPKGGTCKHGHVEPVRRISESLTEGRRYRSECMDCKKESGRKKNQKKKQ